MRRQSAEIHGFLHNQDNFPKCIKHSNKNFISFHNKAGILFYNALTHIISKYISMKNL